MRIIDEVVGHLDFRDGSLESLVNVGDEVIEVFDSDRDADEVVGDAKLGADFGRNGCVGHDGWKLGERLVSS